MPHQKKVLFEQPERFKTLIWHRRARKTTTAIIELVKQSQMRIGPYWHIFPTYGEAKNAIWRDPNMLFGIIPPELIVKKNEAEMVVYLKNGSYIQLIGSDNPDRLRGAGPMGVVLDEYDTMKNDVWPIIEPILRANGGWAWFVGTPKGKQKLFRNYTLGQQGHPEWFSYLLKASESGIISDDQLREAKATAINEAFYGQEFECDFLDGVGSVFRNVREAMTSQPEEPKENHLYVMGVDLAKVTDYTVISIFDRSNNRQVFRDRFNTLEWPMQKARIIATAQKYNNALNIIDGTGIGDPIIDDLLRAGVAVEPYKFTEQSKKDLVEKLSIWIEQKKASFIYGDDVMMEYDNFTYEIGLTGKIRYGAREGFHDDIIMADALAVWSLQPIILKPKIKEIGIIKKDYREKIQDLSSGENDNDYESY